MGETIDKNKYLDFDGLKKYDELVKKYISSAHDALSDNINSSLKGYVNENVDEIKESISDLDTIRSGAAAGATALQAVPAEYVTESELTGKGYLTVNDLSFAVDSDIDALFA
jgi:hypothetical protein